MVKWPYSSSRHEMAVILAEPSLRLRRAKGHVKVRFTNVGDLSLAIANIIIGDEMFLSLQGAVVLQLSAQVLARQSKAGLGLERCAGRAAIYIVACH